VLVHNGQKHDDLTRKEQSESPAPPDLMDDGRRIEQPSLPGRRHPNRQVSARRCRPRQPGDRRAADPERGSDVALTWAGSVLET
jgi:hypothetical protein